MVCLFCLSMMWSFKSFKLPGEPYLGNVFSVNIQKVFCTFSEDGHLLAAWGELEIMQVFITYWVKFPQKNWTGNPNELEALHRPTYWRDTP